SVRLESQRVLARLGAREVGLLSARLRRASPVTGRLHALWALDAIGTPEARAAVTEALGDPQAGVQLQAGRGGGIRRDRAAVKALPVLLRDPTPAVRREAAIALGKIGDPSAAPGLMAALGDSDEFVAWSVRRAIRTLNAWDVEALTTALLDAKRRD